MSFDSTQPVFATKTAPVATEGTPAATKPEWFQMLEAECKRTSIGAVALRLDYSRTAISLVLADKYLGKTDKIEKAVIRVLAGSVACPYTKTDIPHEDCREISSRRAPTHNPTTMAQWRACQSCPNNCKGGKS